MIEAVGNRVESLSRTRLGPLKLGRLPEGEARRLTAAEVQKLR
jgi:16S rRNA U516 pseudouridylate synthase RsuA-like enzyme